MLPAVRFAQSYGSLRASQAAVTAAPWPSPAEVGTHATSQLKRGAPTKMILAIADTRQSTSVCTALALNLPAAMFRVLTRHLLYSEVSNVPAPSGVAAQWPAMQHGCRSCHVAGALASCKRGSCRGH